METRLDATSSGSSAAPRWRRLALALAVLLAAAVAVVVAVVFGTRSSPQPTTNNGVSSAGVATVGRRDLVETDTESGILSYADPETVYNRLSGTVTWLPSIGEVIRPGQTLYKVDRQPVVLFDGAALAYRELKAGDSDGEDILQLNRDLVQMGFADG